MRAYQDPIALDYDATARFFQGRGQRMAEVGPLSAVLYQDQQPELAARRSAHELAIIAPRLTEGRGRLSVLDVGCGTGRWAATLQHAVDQFNGLDFCDDFLREAERACASLPQPQRFCFAPADLSKGLPEQVVAGSFDTVVMAGVLLYLNDEDAAQLLRQLARRLAPGGRIYLREPLGITQRLTLSSHFSDELKAEYSSVYRSVAEFKHLLVTHALSEGLTLWAHDALYPAALDNRSDTRQFYYLMDKA